MHIPNRLPTVIGFTLLIVFMGACAVRHASGAEHAVPTAAGVGSERDTVYARRVRMFDQLAAHVPTDSLAHLYLAALDAPAGEGRVLLDAISCQDLRLDWQYGKVAAAQAIRRMTDSVLATPALRERWSAAQDRFPITTDIRFDCVRGLVPAADSLNEEPHRG